MGALLGRGLPKPAGPYILEADWQAQVVKLAGYCGWKHYHTHNSQHSVAGWPDLVLIRPPRLLAVELKTRTGRVTPQQQAWLDDLAACGVETYVWRPADLSQIRAVLARRP